MADALYRYSATVNKRFRQVIFKAPDGLTSGQLITEYVDNHEDNYNRFYLDATPEDYEAERVEDRVEIWGWSEVDS